MFNLAFNNSIFFGSVLAASENAAFYRSKDGKNKSAIYQIKYFCWVLALILMSPHKEIKGDETVWVFSKIAEKRISSYIGNAAVFRLGLYNSSIRNLHTNISVISPYSPILRIKLAVLGVRLFCKDNLGCNLGEYLEYFFIVNYLFNHQINHVYLNHACERYNTLITHVCFELGIEIILIQDGAAIGLNFPNKLFANKAYVFDLFEEKILRKYVSNKDCKFKHIGFCSTINWKTFSKSRNIKLIAIASQDWHTSQTNILVKELLKVIEGSNTLLIVYPHYRESRKDFAAFNSCDNVLIEPHSRYKNIDILITFYSTIVYDYWSVNPDLEVLCQRIHGYTPAYYYRNNVKVFNSASDLSLYVQTLLNS